MDDSVIIQEITHKRLGDWTWCGIGWAGIPGKPHGKPTTADVNCMACIAAKVRYRYG